MDTDVDKRAARHRVLIVGGGAGGLELATRLGHVFKGDPVDVVLVDAALTHVWKPLLHEVAAGSLDMGNNEIDYLTHAHQHGFQFHLGTMEKLDRAHRKIWLAPRYDDVGMLMADRRALRYDTLIMAVGSHVNDFHTPGVAEHAIMLNTLADAQRLHMRMLSICLRINEGTPVDSDIAIIGAGATGVELAAELHGALKQYTRYVNEPRLLKVRIKLVEAADTILGNLPAKVRARVGKWLDEKGIQVLTGQRVQEVTAEGLKMAQGPMVPAQLVIWAAGVQAPAWLAQLDGLPCNKLNQLLLNANLQSTVDERIFGLGDCVSCTPPGRDKPVPPLAQVAHQQAHYLARVIPLHVRGIRQLPAFAFHDHGSLISLGQDQAVGTLIGRLTGHGFFVEGLAARWTYWALYRGYLTALHGWLKMLQTTLGNWLTHSTKSRVKLH